MKRPRRGSWPFRPRAAPPYSRGLREGLDRPAPLEKVSVYIQDIGFLNPPLGGRSAEGR